jgi:outer membrane protein insertion porin family
MRAFPFLVAGLIALVAPGRAGAQALDQYLGRPITEIRLRLDGAEVRDPDVSRALETKAGDALTTLAVRESVMHLMALARFQDVTVDAQLAPAGVALVYDLVRARTVRAVRFTGDLGLPAGQLRAAVVERYTASPALWRAPEAATMLEGFCRDRGYPNASVTYAAEPQKDPGSLTLVFRVAAGRPAAIGAVTVEGAPGGNQAAVASQLGLKPGARLDRVRLDAAVSKYAARLRTDGYLEAKVTWEPAYSAAGDRADVAIRMARGPKVAIEFRGDPLPDARRKEILSLLSEGVLDEDALENEERSIEDGLRARGFRDALVSFTREARAADRTEVIFTVAQGVQYRIADVAVVGNREVPLPEIQPGLHVKPGQWLVTAALDGEARTLEELYRRRGFRTAKVAWTAESRSGEPGQVVVRFAITEGPRTTVSGIEFARNTKIATDVLAAQVRSQVGGPYYKPQVDDDRDAVLVEYVRRGYQLAKVTVPAEFSADGTAATLRFTIDEGPQLLLDHVLVAGNKHTASQTIVREMGLVPGRPLSPDDLIEAQRRVSELGLFRRVQVSELSGDVDDRRDVLVTVAEAPVNSIGYGGGLEGGRRLKTNAATGLPEEKFDLAPRGFFSIGRRNLWGKNRSIDLFLRGAIRSGDTFNTDAAPPPGTPSGSPTDTSSGAFPEYRVVGSYREPKFLNLPFDLVVAASVEQAIRSTFDFNRLQVSADAVRRLGSGLTVLGRYSLGRTRLFNEKIAPEDQLNVDKLFPQVRLSMLSASIIRNTRDDAFEPKKGTLLSFDASLAARVLGSEVGFIKGSWQAFAYKQVPFLGGAVLAGGARLGLATGFSQLVPDPSGSGQLIPLDQEIPASERFFAGGDTSVRAFALDQLGSASTLDVNGVSNGGNGSVIFNGEVRVPIWRAKGLGGAVFVDTGNVFATVGDIRFAELRTGAGFGIRWKSPIGPLRLDLAWKLKPITFENGQKESRFSWYITIGQAF